MARQYTQLMALLNNWDYFKENLQVAYDSEGSLNEQQKIYEESWAAASKRVQASIQGIYQALLDDSFFIKINNWIATALGGLESFIEKFGGFKSILASISGILLNMFAGKIAEGFKNVKYNIDFLVKGSKGANDRIVDQTQKATEYAYSHGINKDSTAGVQLENANQLLAVKQKLALVNNNLSASERLMAQTQINAIQTLQEEAVKLQQKKELLEETLKVETEVLQKRSASFVATDTNEQMKTAAEKGSEISETLYRRNIGLINKNFNGKGSSTQAQKKSDILAMVDQVKEFETAYNNSIRKVKQQTQELGKELLKVYSTNKGDSSKITDKLTVNLKEQIDMVSKLNDQINNLGQNGKGSINTKDSRWTAFTEQLEQIRTTIPEVVREATGLDVAFDNVKNSANITDLNQNMANLKSALQGAGFEGENLEAVLRGIYGADFDKVAKSCDGLRQNLEKSDENAKNLKKTLDDFNVKHIQSATETFVQLGSSVTSAISAFNSGSSIVKSFADTAVSGGEKAISIITSLASTFTSVGFAAKGAASVIKTLFSLTSEAAGVWGLALAAVVAIGGAIWQVIENSKNSWKGNLDAAEEATAAYEEEKSKIDSLNSSLAETRDRIKELNALENPSLIDQEELNAAKEEAAVLERQVALQEQLLKVTEAKKNAALAAVDLEDTYEAVVTAARSFLVPNEFASVIAYPEDSNVIVKTDKKNTTAYSIYDAYKMAQLAERQGQSIYATHIWDAIFKNSSTNGLLDAMNSYTGLAEEDDVIGFVETLTPLIKDYEDGITSYEDKVKQLISFGYSQGQIDSMSSQLVEETYGSAMIQLIELQEQLTGSAPLYSVYTDLTLSEGGSEVVEGAQLGIELPYKVETQKEEVASIVKSIKDYEILIAEQEDKIREYSGNSDSDIDEMKENLETLQEAYSEKVTELESWQTTYLPYVEQALNSIYQQLMSGDLLKSEQEYLTQMAAAFMELYFVQSDNWQEDAAKLAYKTISSTASQNLQSNMRDAWGNEKFWYNFKDSLGQEAELKANAYGVELEAVVDYLKNSVNEEMDNYARVFSQSTTQAWKDLDQNEKDLWGERLQELRASDNWSDSYLSELSSLNLRKIDFNNENWTEDIIEQIEIILNQTGEELDYLADIENLTKKTSELEIGKILSEEDYELLVKYNAALKDYFIYTSSGYKYLGGANSLINNLVPENFKEQIKKTKDFYQVVNEKVGLDFLQKNASDEGYSSNKKLNNMLILDDEVIDFVKNNSYQKDIQNLNLEKLQNQFNNSETRAEAIQVIETFWTELLSLYNQAEEVALSNTDELRYSYASTLGELEQLYKEDNNDEVYEKQLRAIAGSYEECEEALNEYSEEVKAAAGDAEKLQKAQNKLAKAIKKIEWDNFTEEALEYAQALKTATSEKDIYKNLKSIQKAFQEKMGFEVSMEALEKYKDKFVEWGDAGEEESDDVATQLYSLLQLEESLAEGEGAFANFNEDIQMKVDVDDGEAYSKFANLQDFYTSVKEIVEGNPPVVDAYGNADFSNMIAAMLEAGYTAADVAAALQSIGQTEVDFSAWGTGLPAVNFNDINSIVGFINALNSWRGSITGDTNAPITSEALKNTFGGSLPAATGSGGGRHNGGSSSSSSGGGGGSTKHAEKKNDSDKERYHTIKNQLEDIQAEYEDIADAADRAFGKDKLDNMDAEIAKTDELIAKQKEYVEAIEANLPIDQAIMGAYYTDVIGGPAMEFDERGNISNYDAIQDAMFDKYNQMADAYTEDSETWKAFEKQYEQLEKYIEQYEETYDLLRDQEQEYQDLLNERIDLQLEKVQYKVELKLDISKDEVELIKYQLDKISDDGFKSLESVALLSAEAEELNKQIQINKQGLNDALELSMSAAEIAELMAGNMNVLSGKNFTEDQVKTIKDYRDALLSANEELDKIRESVEDQLMTAFDAWQEKLTNGATEIDHYKTILEDFKNIIDIVDTESLGLNDAFMNNLAQGTVNNAIDKLKAAKAEFKAIEDIRLNAQENLAAARADGDTESEKMWEETLNTLNEKAQTAQQNMLTAWEDALTQVADQFEQSVERIVETFNKSVYQLGGLEGLSNDFAKEQERADIMLDDYTKIYELSKLSRDINKSIDDTDLIGGKQKLKKLLQEINDLQEDGVEMSQYDLEYLQKTYDLRLAELELEEAQKAKNTVRLAKDNEGNWSYIYTQNSDAVDAAQQKYEDALYAMQDLSSNYIDEMSEKLITTSQEMAEALAELRIQDFASLDDYYAEVERVQVYYQEQMDLQENELNKAVLNNKTLYDEDWTAYHNATGYKISDTEDFVTAFKDSVLGVLMNSESDTSNFNSLIAASTATMTESLLQAAQTYFTNLEDAMNAADTSVGSFGEDVGASIDEVATKSEEGAAAVEDMAERMNTAVYGVMDTIVEWQESYGTAMQKVIESNLDVIESFNDMMKTLSAETGDVTVTYSLAKAAGEEADIEQFASGGYTGAWGSTGKLAILDEKELILNSHDTENMLDMLKLTHNLLNMIDLQAQNAQLGFGALEASSIKDASEKEAVVQEVYVTAEFPAATDRNEIREALLTLPNVASQYANRK